MEKKTITIEEIESNPNLDLTERIEKFSQNKKWSNDDLRELAIASIKQEYEYMINNMSNIPNIDLILDKILNGYVLKQDELFEMMTSNSKEKVKKYNTLKKNIEENNGITIDDFNELCKTIDIDSNTTELIKNLFMHQGKIIDSYSKNESKRNKI